MTIFEKKEVKTANGTWVINGDGTVCDSENNLRWIQAPWGMKWEGNGFSGEPKKLKWAEATRLFGKGVYAYSDRAKSSKRPNDWKDCSPEKGYTFGSSKTWLCGYSTWRLPTAFEWCRLNEIGHGHSPQIFADTSGAFWTATGKLKFLWFPSVAWKGWFGRPINDENVNGQLPIYLVR